MGTAPDPKIILCGPFPAPHLVGGYARANELTATSFLADEFGIQRLAVSLPGEGHFARRLWTDIRRTRRCLRQSTAPVFHLTAQKFRGIYREWLQFQMARRAGRRFLLDLRAGRVIEACQDRSRPVQRALLVDMLRRADAIAVEGRAYVEWIAREFGREALWFPNFVHAAYREQFPRAPLTRPAPGQPLRVIYSGRLAEGKGLEELVLACGMVEREHALSIRLDLAGPGEAGFDGRLGKVAGELGPKQVTFHGRVEHGDLLRLLAMSHIFAFPTRWSGEGHPNAVNEAMQVGLPVVTTNQGFLPDVVSADCGVRLRDPSPDAIAGALVELSRDWERLRACGANAHERVYRLFSDEVVLRKLGGLYRTLLRSGSQNRLAVGSAAR